MNHHDASDYECPTCGAHTGKPCDGVRTGYAHTERVALASDAAKRAAERAAERAKK